MVKITTNDLNAFTPIMLCQPPGLFNVLKVVCVYGAQW